MKKLLLLFVIVTIACNISYCQSLNGCVLIKDYHENIDNAYSRSNFDTTYFKYSNNEIFKKFIIPSGKSIFDIEDDSTFHIKNDGVYLKWIRDYLEHKITSDELIFLIKGKREIEIEQIFIQNKL